MKTWRLIPRVRFINYRKCYPDAHPDCFTKWLSVTRWWHGRVITICFKALAVSFDFRRDWVADMNWNL